MQVTFCSKYFEPFTQDSGSSEVANLAGLFVRKGWDVRAIIPGLEGDPPDGISLARRLSKIQVSWEGAELNFGRFDGRTAAGVDILILDCNSDDQRVYSPVPFGLASSALLDSLDTPSDIVVVINNEIHLSAAMNQGERRVLLITDKGVDVGDVSGFDQVVVVGSSLAAAFEADPGSGLGQMIRNGTASVLPTASSKEPVDSASKASHKASCQYNFGLPVRDVALIYLGQVGQVTTQELSKLLAQDVQVVALSDNPEESIQDLVGKYPDRLAVLPEEAEDTPVVEGCDFCLCVDGAQVADCLAIGTVPVVHDAARDAAVDLDPTLASGSGICFGGETGRTLSGALTEAMGVYSKRDSFAKLCRRLPGYATNWSAFADKLVDIVSND